MIDSESRTFAAYGQRGDRTHSSLARHSGQIGEKGARHEQGGGRDHDLGRRLHHRPRRRTGTGLGEGGERLHNWVFGGPWRYEEETRGEASGEDAAWLENAMARIGAVVAGRTTYESARHWGERNPWGLPVFIVTHRPDTMDLEQLGVRQSRFATFVDYAVKR